MITFAVEPWAGNRNSIMPLWRRHYDEIAQDKDRIPLDPDWAKYDHLAAADALHIVTARQAGALVGYAFVVVDTHLHYRTTLFAQFDLYWLAPEHRGGRTALRLFQAVERHMASLGVVKAMANTKLTHDHGRLFAHMGWREAERLFVKTPGG